MIPKTRFVSSLRGRDLMIPCKRKQSKLENAVARSAEGENGSSGCAFPPN